MATKKTTQPHMSANDITSFYPTHPGSILKDEIEYRGIPQCKLAKEMGIAPTTLNEILNCRRPLTEKTALLFEAVLGVDAEPLLSLQLEYNIRQIRKDGNLYKKVQDPNLIGQMSGHVDGSRAFKRYRKIEDETLRDTVNLLIE